jgi:hypothetical protein
VKCKKCQTTEEYRVDIPQQWLGFSNTPITCDKCNNIFWIHNETTTIETTMTGEKDYTEKIPSISNDTVVFIVNKEHPRYLQTAIVIDKEHAHYRIEFPDLLVIWVPEHWVRAIPSNSI